jgi:hypothetical protein
MVQTMARVPRIDVPDIAQHVVQRGNDRQPCFVALGDYAGYFCELAEAMEKGPTTRLPKLYSDACFCSGEALETR